MLTASMLTLVAVCFASLGVWRLTQDVELTGGFVYTEGILSHWQVWIFAAVATQYGAWRLTQYAHLARTPIVGETETVEPVTESSGITPAKV